MDVENFDVLIIGAGSAGNAAAQRLAAGGIRVAMVDRDRAGGTCLNWGCIPTKALAAAARRLLEARKAGDMGIRIGTIAVDPVRLFEGVWEKVDSLAGDLAFSLKKAPGLVLLRGEAQARPDGTFTVTQADGLVRSLSGKKALIACGAAARSLPGIELDGNRVVDARGMLEAGTIPKRLAVIGGGAIGCEMGWIFHTLGSRVTILELTNQLLPGTDPDVSRTLAVSFRKAGMDIRLGVGVERVEPGPEEALVRIKDGESFTAERVLLSVGRAPDLGWLEPGKLGVELDKGRLKVDEFMETTRPGWFAAGDCVPGPMLAYTASDGGLLAAENISGGRARRKSKAAPLVTFCWPEVAQVGEVVSDESRFCSARHFFKGNSRARVEGEDEGLVKVFAEKGSGRIRGVSMVGPFVSEMVGEATVLVEEGVTLERFNSFLQVHPALHETLAYAALRLQGRC